ncbi:MAG: hypothetical protein R3F39_10260 [Myxococcota bacterium]
MRDQDDRTDFYAVLGLLAAKTGGPRALSECHGRMGWPRRGVYYFFEPGEPRGAGADGLRVVRVGTHAVSSKSRTSLWQRLAQHRGTAAGTGNHRGSIFRLLVGEAIIHRGGLNLPSWGTASSPGSAAKRLGLSREALKALEAPLERKVGEVIGAMPLLWVEVDDEPGTESARGFIERNSIALLAGGAAVRPAGEWLGAWSRRQAVREGGLWNQNHVAETYDPSFIERFAELVARM